MASQPTGSAHEAGQTTGSPQRAPQQLTGALLAFDLAAEAGQLRAELAYQEGDRNANTLLKEKNARVVMMALRKDTRLHEHQTSGWVIVQTLLGHVELRALGQTVDLPSGHLATLEPGAAHDVTALEDSVLLLTVAWTGDQAGAAS
ncbi:MAG TPA: AraC family ligand binding domain-containing protein [Chloroflexota bacterium]|nr:AraC family ligand binding domain-containing protein [Chloroflexota bacterium]